MKLQNLMILLFMDNAPVHVIDCSEALTNIKVEFFPPNSTSCLQPLDAGIIRSFKALFQRLMLSKLVDFIDIDENLSVNQIAKRLNVLDAMRLILRSWNGVSTNCIRRCFAKCGFNVEFHGKGEEDTIAAALLSGFPELEDVSCEDLVSFDEGQPICRRGLQGDEEIDNQILEEFLFETKSVDVEEDNDEEAGEEEVEKELERIPTSQECLDAIAVLGRAGFDGLHSLDSVKAQLIRDLTAKRKQSSIKEYFSQR